jgi:thiol-disulfide isomerase/thioredoxin
MALQNALSFYPVDIDKIIKQLKRTISKEKKNYKLSFESFISEHKGTWAGEMVANKPVYFTNPKQDWRLQDFEKREQFWDNINTTNQSLINSPLYTEHILEYIKYYMNPEMQFGEEEMNQGFKKSVDNVMQKFSSNAQTQEFALKYLQLGFKEIGNEEVLQYIDENYQKVLLQCSNENADRIAFEKRISGYATMKIGNNAPNFNLKTPNLSNSTVGLSDTFDLFDIKAKQTLVFFWASWCPHCMEEMPKVNEWAATQKDVKVVAVSLDTDKSLYLDLINQFPNVTHSCDFKGWESQAAVSFFITATPTFILLDEDKKIINKRTSINEYTQSN